MRSFIEKPRGRELTIDDISKVSGKKYIDDVHDVIYALNYYRERGEEVYYIKDNYCLLHSNTIRTYEDAREILRKGNMHIIVHPITSLEEFQKQVDNLGDWRDQKNHLEYCKIMLQLVSMCKGYDVRLELEDGISGVFSGSYPENYFDKLKEIISSKFPTPNELFNSDNKLKEEFRDEDLNFYSYLGNFYAGENANFFLDSNFINDMYAAGIKYRDYEIDMDTIRKIVSQSKDTAKSII